MALTEKYVSALAAGGGTGNTTGSPYTWAEMVTEINAGSAAGNRYNTKNDGTYSRTTTTDTLSGSGSSTSPVIIRGYSSTIGDYDLGRTSGYGPLITTNMPAVTYTTGRYLPSGSWIITEGVNFTGAPSNPLVSSSPNGAMHHCVANNSSTNGSAFALTFGGVNGVAVDNDLTLSGASGGNGAVFMNANDCRLIANRIKGGPNAGVAVNQRAVVIGNVIFRGASGSGGSGAVALLNTGSAAVIAYNTIVNQGNSGDGISVVTGTTILQLIFGNIITDNARYGINGIIASNAIFAAYNRLRDNSTSNTNLATDWLAATSYGHVTTGAGTSDYTNAGSDDYSLIGSSPAREAGLFKYADIGAVQKRGGGGRPLASSIIQGVG